MPYQRVDMEELTKAFAELEKDMEAAGSGEEAFAVHERFYKVLGHAMTEFTLAEIRGDIDMTDPFYREEQTYNDSVLPAFRNMEVSYRKKLMNSPYRAYLEEKIGPVAFVNMDLAAKSVDEKILPLMQEENELETRYNRLLATAKIDWEGETKNLSLMSPYMRSSDRAVRKAAWEKYAAFFAENKEEMDEIYDRMVKNRTRQGELMGHADYLPLGDARMQRNCYGRDDLARFRAQVKKDWVPFAERIHEKRRQRLGLPKLAYYDEGIIFPNGNPAPVGTPEQILEAGRRMYNELSPETAEFINFMCDNGLFDVLGRKTKKSGGYMTFLPDYRAPFVFANFNGTAGDADVITHECGHAFQGFVSAKDPIMEHGDITMETAETHSMSMEFFTERWMDLLFGSRADDYRYMHLCESILFIPYGTMVDEFQEIMYKNPGLSPKDRDGVWKDLERQYRPHMDYTGNALYEQGAFWQNKHHIYDNPLYYIDYCIAQTNALQYKAWMDRDFDGAWKSYYKLCELSAKDFFFGLVDAVGLQNPFESGCLAYVAGKMEPLV